MKLALVLIALLATPTFADYEAGFGYQATLPAAPRYTYGSGHRHGHHSHRYLPRREVTTIERNGNRTRIETRRFYRDGGTARVITASPRKWSARSR